jgi:hypothetical protein
MEGFFLRTGSQFIWSFLTKYLDPMTAFLLRSTSTTLRKLIPAQEVTQEDVIFGCAQWGTVRLWSWFDGNGLSIHSDLIARLAAFYGNEKIVMFLVNLNNHAECAYEAMRSGFYELSTWCQRYSVHCRQQMVSFEHVKNAIDKKHFRLLKWLADRCFSNDLFPYAIKQDCVVALEIIIGTRTVDHIRLKEICVQNGSLSCLEFVASRFQIELNNSDLWYRHIGRLVERVSELIRMQKQVSLLVDGFVYGKMREVFGESTVTSLFAVWDICSERYYLVVDTGRFRITDNFRHSLIRRRIPYEIISLV